MTPWALALLTAGGLALRLAYLSQPLRHDETMTYLQFARLPPSELLASYASANNHLLHTLLMHGTTRLLGDAPWAIRLPALAAGVLLIPATYVMTVRLYGRAAAILAAALVAGSSLMVEYSVNSRGYGLMTLGVVLAAAWAAGLVRTPRLGGWLVWAVPIALGFYAVPLMAIPAAALVAWTVLEAERAPDPTVGRATMRGVAVGVVASGVLAAALYAPALAALGPAGAAGAVAHAAGPALPPAEAVAGVGAHAAAIWQSWHRNCHTPVALALGAAAVLAAVAHRRIGRHRVSLAAVMLAFVLPLAALTQVRPRLALFAVPLYYAAAAAGLALPIERLLVGRRAEIASVTVALGLFLLLGVTELRSRHVYWSWETGATRDAVELAEQLATTIRPGDVLLHARAPVAYHLEKRGVPVRDANVINERGTITPVYYLEPPPVIPPPAPRRLFVVVYHARRDGPAGRRIERDTVATTLAFRGFPSLVSSEWRMVHDVNEASVYLLAEPVGSLSAHGVGFGRRPGTVVPRAGTTSVAGPDRLAPGRGWATGTRNGRGRRLSAHQRPPPPRRLSQPHGGPLPLRRGVRRLPPPLSHPSRHGPALAADHRR